MLYEVITAAGMGVRLAELVVLPRRGVERHDGRDAAHPPAEQHGGNLGVHEEGVEPLVRMSPPQATFV